MMTLEEAIKHAEEKSNGCSKCNDEHRQLAEWLKELKYFKEMPKMSEVIKECPNCGSHYMEMKTDPQCGICIVCSSCGEIIVDTRQTTRRRFYRGDVVSHFKGSYYEILYPRAKYCTNGQEGYVVIYKKYGDRKSPVYVRDYDEFMSKVDFKKYPDAEQEYRFEFRFNVDDGV